MNFFQADLTELAAPGDCGDREEEWACDMFTAHITNAKIFEELLTETRSQQRAYEWDMKSKRDRT